MESAPLGGLSARAFLRRHWQKKRLFAPAAVPDVPAMLTPRDIIALACRDDIESRLVVCEGRQWSVREGPLRRSDLSRLPSGGWSLLVQGVDSHVPAARALMRRFGFVPYARQDDLMVSLAPPGGGVGPHFDSYDVFLLQGRGRRRWRVSTQSDLDLVEGAPLRILRRFVAEEEYAVAPGDLLYLPPHVAHDGVAIDECMTYSVGLRAPSHQELATRYSEWLQDQLQVAGRYTDPDLAPQRHPAIIPPAMVRATRDLIAGITRRPRDTARFLGCFLTEPKSSVWFSPPAKPMTRAVFARRVAARGIALDLKSRLLVYGRNAFINGETIACDACARAALLKLADDGMLAPGSRLRADTIDQMHRWYLAGYVVLP
jgi:50S ribosomal protein L16 3-hydroxylase